MLGEVESIVQISTEDESRNLTSSPEVGIVPKLQFVDPDQDESEEAIQKFEAIYQPLMSAGSAGVAIIPGSGGVMSGFIPSVKLKYKTPSTSLVSSDG
jgi:hypothetical protein